MTVPPARGDQKQLTKERQKKIALGQREDDYGDDDSQKNQGWQMKMY